MKWLYLWGCRRDRHPNAAFHGHDDGTITVRCTRCRTDLTPKIKVWNGRGYGKHIYS